MYQEPKVFTLSEVMTFIDRAYGAYNCGVVIRKIKDDAIQLTKQRLCPTESEQQPVTQMKTIKPSQAQEIINSACPTWKKKLVNIWAVDIVSNNVIEISDEFYDEMRKACTLEQHKLFDGIFGVDELKFKKDDWVFVINGGNGALGANTFVGKLCDRTEAFAVNYNGCWRNDEAGAYVINTNKGVSWGLRNGYKLRKATPEEIAKASVYPDGTPCLVSDSGREYCLRYADGEGRFYVNGYKSGVASISFIHHRKLDINNLP